MSQLFSGKDMKYHVPTGLVFRRRRAVFILLASLKGCFLCFCFSTPSIYSLNLLMDLIGCRKFTHEIIRDNLC